MVPVVLTTQLKWKGASLFVESMFSFFHSKPKMIVVSCPVHPHCRPKPLLSFSRGVFRRRRRAHGGWLLDVWRQLGATASHRLLAWNRRKVHTTSVKDNLPRVKTTTSVTTRHHDQYWPTPCVLKQIFVSRSFLFFQIIFVSSH